MQYNFKLGRKGIMKCFSLQFRKVDFHHIIGFQYLTDVPQLRKDRTKVYDDICNNKITFQQICKSNFYPVIENRISFLAGLERYLDSNELVFKYNRKINPFSNLQAEYVLSSIENSQTIYIFIDKIDNTDTYFCRSFFPKGVKDYTKGHARYTVLHKEKINKITNESKVLFSTQARL